MHPDADRSQLAGNTDPPRPYGPRALIGGALGVFAVAAIVVGAAVISREGGATSTFGERRSKMSDESLATSTQHERQVESMMAMSVELAALRATSKRSARSDSRWRNGCPL